MFLLALPFSISANVFAATTSVYTHITARDIYLYSQPINSDNYKLFAVPISFFVELTGNAGDSENLFYSAKYMDIAGYIKKSEVSAVQGTPVSPYANNLSFRVFSPSGLDLRSSPSSLTPFNIVINVPFRETGLVYYGSCSGEEMISQRGSDWYYCKYISSSNKYFGFLYSGLCDLLPVIPTNSENLPAYEGELFQQTPTEPVNQTNGLDLSNWIKAIIVVAICLPCFLIIYLLFKPTKLIVDNGAKGKSKIKKLRRSEYYELDD